MRTTWIADCQNYDIDTTQPGWVEQMAEMTKKVEAMLEEGVKGGIVMMVDWPGEPYAWRVLKWRKWGRLCWKHGFKLERFKRIREIVEREEVNR